MNYSAGAWNSLSAYSYGNFSFVAKSTSVSGINYLLQVCCSISLFFLGTAMVLAAVGGNSSILQEIAFSLPGVNKTQAQLISWTSNYQYIHATLDLGVDLSQV